MPRPVHIVRMINERLSGQVPAEEFKRLPCPHHTTLALLCLRKLGYQAHLIQRVALAHRNDEDNLYRNYLDAAAEITPELVPLLNRARAHETDLDHRFDPRYKEITVFALRVTSQEGEDGILDGFGNELEDDILVHAASQGNRRAAHYIKNWEPALVVALERHLDLIDREPIVGQMVALWQSLQLQQATDPAAPISAVQRRL